MAGGAPWVLAAALAGSLATTPIAVTLSGEPRAEHTAGLASKKAEASQDGPRGPVLATLVDTHTVDHVPLDAESPDAERFEALLADRVTGARERIDPRLLELLRTLARAHPGARFELVSGYRSAKLNEMLRKKGHHVASHSQHSLGHAVDFRILLPDARDPIDPRALEQEIRAGGWTGGTGVYLGENDRFVHADVGPNRRWNGL
jgi:uncharacterized protein YcbK (DUF882 family)